MPLIVKSLIFPIVLPAPREEPSRTVSPLTFNIAFPAPLEDAYDKFIQGKYSEMYFKKEIEDLFSDSWKAETRGVLTRTSGARNNFILKVKEEWGTQLTSSDFKKEKYEYDFPPEKKQEIFNQEPLGV